MRFGLFVDAVGPALREAEQVMALPLPKDPEAKLDLAERKIAAEKLIPILRAALFPEDDDG